MPEACCTTCSCDGVRELVCSWIRGKPANRRESAFIYFSENESDSFFCLSLFICHAGASLPPSCTSHFSVRDRRALLSQSWSMDNEAFLCFDSPVKGSAERNWDFPRFRCRSSRSSVAYQPEREMLYQDIRKLLHVSSTTVNKPYGLHFHQQVRELLGF